MKFGLLSICLILTLPLCASAQSERVGNSKTSKNFSVLSALISPIEFESWLSKKSEGNENFKLKIFDSSIDIVGNIHYKYKQLYKDIEVDGSAINLHCKKITPFSYNGVFFPKINVSQKPRITEAIALEKAKQSFNKASVFSWENNGGIFQNIPLGRFAKTLNDTPNAELVVLPMNIDIENTEFRYAYKFKISTSSPFDFKLVYIDAENGNILLTKDLINHIDKKAVAYTKYSGKQDIVCDSLDVNLYTLIERDRGLDSIIVENAKNPPSYLFYNSDTAWKNFNTEKDEVAGDVMWAIEKTYDYFKEKFGRNSFDNKGHAIHGLVHSGTNNASWLNGGEGIAVFGDGDNVSYDAWTSIDIVAHEITHGVNQNSANLLYLKESGALSESFSDIFAKCVEKYALPDSFTWSIGKPITIGGHPPIRVMNNPNFVKHPKYYFGKYFDLVNSDDFYGVHTNSGVQNYWFYLLCEGGIGNRELDFKPYSVGKIGMDTASIIAYYTLTNYLTEFSGFEDACFYSIAATKLLFGESSHLVNEVSNAWYAVGLLNTTSINERHPTKTFSVFPNPSSDLITIRSEEIINSSQFKLVDISGREMSINFNSQNQSEVTASISSLSSGLYFIEVKGADGKVLIKIIKK